MLLNIQKLYVIEQHWHNVHEKFGVEVIFFIKRCTMAEISESADSRQLLNQLKGKMLALKEHL